jgi:hypothetical protein
MAISRAQQRAERRGRVGAIFDETLVDPVLDLLELTELAWHDCYGEITPSEEIVDDILLCSEGKVAKLIQTARLAVKDWRDLKVWAQQIRTRENSN